MRSISLTFQMHQPFQLNLCRFFDIGRGIHYVDDFQNRYLTERFSDKCYIPANRLLLNMFNAYADKFKCSFSVAGTTLDTIERYRPETIAGLCELSKSKGVEFLATPYHNTLAFIKNKKEFDAQVKLQHARIENLFGQSPKVLSNLNLIYSDAIGKMTAEMGYKGMLVEGAKHIMGWKSPNFVYHNAFNPDLKLLVRNFQLTDDISFRFSDKSWNSYPLTTEKFVDWLNKLPQDLDCVNICLDYSVLGEMHAEDSGIFDFIHHLPKTLNENSDFSFATPTEICKKTNSVAPVYVPHAISWSGQEKDLSAWLGNELQKEAFTKLYSLEKKVLDSGDVILLSQWRNLQNADNFYAMNTKWEYRQNMRNRFNSPYDAFINYMNLLSDFSLKVDNLLASKVKKAPPKVKKAVKEAATKKSSVSKKEKAIKENSIDHILQKSKKQLTNVEIPDNN